MTGSLPQAIPAMVKTSGVGLEPSKRLQRRARRATETSSQSGGGLVLPGRSLKVGPAPGTQRVAPPEAVGEEQRLQQVSEALRIDLPEGDVVDQGQWLLSKLPEIVEQCCRHQGPPSRVIEVLPPPMRRKIRINVTTNPARTSSERYRADRSDDQRDESTDEFVLDEEGLRRTRRSPPPSRSRRRRPTARREASSSATSPESGRRSPGGDAATAQLVRQVLEEMFGPRSAAGGGTVTNRVAEIRSTGRSRSCQTSPRLLPVSSGADGVRSGGGEGGDERGSATEVTAQTNSPVRSPQQPPSLPPPSQLSPPVLTSRSPPPPQPQLTSPTGTSRSPSPRPCDTSRCILDTLTESNRLLRQMSEFFRRAELNERVTQRAEFDDRASRRPELSELPELPIIRAEREGRITRREKAGPADDRWRYPDTPPAVDRASGGVTTRSDGGFSRGDGPPPEPLRHCSESELSARIRRYATAAERGMAVRSWNQHRHSGSPLPLVGSPPRTGGDSAPSSGRSWASPQLLELHSADRPYRPLASPPPREADTRPSDAGTEEDGPRTSSPVGTPQTAVQVCSHRQTAADIDSTDALLDYDPWQAIENDFKTLLN